MRLRIGMGVLAVVVVLLVVISTRPDSFRVERAVTIAAPAEIVFARIIDLQEWEQWNPFEKGDPTVTKTFDGMPSTIGASYHYAGEKIGEGRMTVVDAIPDELVAIKAEFIKPFAATNDVEFTLKPVADGVSVSWAMSGHNNLISKAMTLVMNMDRMIGGEFEKGLADIKRVSEEIAQSTDEAAYQDTATID